MKHLLFVLLAIAFLLPSCTKEISDPIIDNDYSYEASVPKLYSINYTLYESYYSKLEDRMFVASTVSTALSAYKQKEFMNEEAAIEWFNDFCSKWDRKWNKSFDICFSLNCQGNIIKSRTIQPKFD